jgi:hypothetical protein
MRVEGLQVRGQTGGFVISRQGREQPLHDRIIPIRE